MYRSLAAFLFLTSTLLSQETTSSGTALTPDNKPIPNAKVTYKSKDGTTVATATTDKNGAFQVKVPVGQDYEISVEADGMEKLVKPLVKSALEQLGKITVPSKPVATLADAEGLVRDSEAKAVAKAKVTIKCGSSQQTITVATDDKGKFTAKLPSEDTYEIKVEAAGYAPVTLQMKKAGLQLVDVLLAKAGVECCEPSKPVLLGLMICFALFWFVAMLVRYNNIAQMDQANIKAALQTLAQEARAPTVPAEVKARIDQFIANADQLLCEARGWKLFWLGFRGKEIAARSNACNARLVLAECYSRDQLLAESRVIVEFLRPEYSNIAAKVEATLSSVTETTPSTEFLRATYISALRVANEKYDDAFAGGTNWQNKAFALVFLGCLLLAATVMGMRNPVLIFVGLLGGFASRLMRGKTTTNSGEASLSWTTLLLSPLYGGFAGWAGILILSVSKELNLVGSAFQNVVWEQASGSNLALGLAFLFGFSERFFSAVTDMAENAITKQKNASAADTSDAKPAAANPNTGIPVGGVSPPAVIGADLASDRQGLKLTGTNLKAVNKVTLKGPATTELEITTKTDTQVDAKASQPLPAGTHAVWINEKDTGKTVA